MSFTHHFSVLPGDERQTHLIDVLLAKGQRVAYDMPLSDLCHAAPVVLGGIPLKYTYEELFFTKGQLFFGGCLSDDFLSSCKENEVTAFDYMKDGELTVFNSIATAEGTISEMIQNSYFNLHGNSVLLFGFGVCAKTLALRLQGLQMKVCICARNAHQRAEALSLGYEAIDFKDLRGYLPGFLFLVNTVPDLVLTAELLNFVHPECLICDIASAPGGVDTKAAEALSIKTRALPGLPGRFAPKASACFMADCIFRHLN